MIMKNYVETSLISIIKSFAFMKVVQKPVRNS